MKFETRGKFEASRTFRTVQRKLGTRNKEVRHFLTFYKNMKFHVITLFPEMITSYVGDSILGRAIESKRIAVKTYNPRSFTKDKWARVDRRPYAGGPGMVLEAESLLKAVEKARGPESKRKSKKTKIIFFAPEGKQFTNVYARQLAKKYDEIIMIAGRYEGVDARVKKILRAETVTVGPYVLTGGEVPAMIVIDAVSRQIEGVLGDFASLEEDRIASPDVYTRPEVLVWKKKNYRVPKVLLGGNHKLIEEWRASIVKKTRPTLEELVVPINAKNLHKPTDWGSPRGKEIIKQSSVH